MCFKYIFFCQFFLVLYYTWIVCFYIMPQVLYNILSLGLLWDNKWMMWCGMLLVTHTQTYSQLPYPYWMVPLKTADTLLISMPMPSPGRSSNSLRPIDRLWISKLLNVEALQDLTSLCVSICVCVHVSVRVLLLVQAIFDFAYKEQGFLCLNAWVSGMLECCLNHFSGFLIHCQQHTNMDIKPKTLKHMYMVVSCGKHTPKQLGIHWHFHIQSHHLIRGTTIFNRLVGSTQYFTLIDTDKI